MEQQFCPYCMTPVAPDESCATCGLTAGNYTPSPHHLPPGTVLMDRYLVGRVLGEGGFGITYIGCDLRLELKVAIKEYFPTDKVTRFAENSLSVSNYTGTAAAQYEAGKKRFLYEARTMAKMDKQPEIVSVRDYFEANNTAYIIMEYVEGTNFKDLVSQKGGRIPAGELLHMIEPLFFALSAMHELGLIHRDISPDNLMLEHGSVRLLDFGCAREAANGEATMTIALKHGYAPIEQYQNKGQGPWTDVYALSATIYYCLTGKRPPQSMDRLCGDELILPRKLGVDLTENQEKALLYGMGIRPRRRFQSIDELHAALYEGSVDIPESERPVPDPAPEPLPASPPPKPAEFELSQTAEIVPPQPEPAPVPSTPTRKKPVLWAGVGGAAILLIVLLAVLLPRGNRSIAEGPDTSEPPPSQSADVQADPFANAVRISAGADEAAFRVMMENGDIPAVIVPAGCGIDICDSSLEIGKPLLIEEGAWINSYQPATVSGEGLLMIEGGFCNKLLRTTGGGSITVAATGSLNGEGLVWLEHEDDLTVEPGGAAESRARRFGETGCETYFLVLSEEELFANAVHVNTEAEFRAAAEAPDTTAIVIDSSITLSKNLLHTVPVLISEGVQVAGTIGWDWDSEDSRTWQTDGAVLINRGTLDCDLNTGDWSGSGLCTIINYGSVGPSSLFLDCPGSLVNYGSITTIAAQVLQMNLYNVGTLLHAGRDNGENFLNIYCETACNFGELVESGSNDGYTTLTHGVYFHNIGTIRVQDGGFLDNQATLDNMGLIRVDAGGNLGNAGYLLVDNAGRGVLDLDPDSTLGYTGLFQVSTPDALDLPNNVENGGGHTACFMWGVTDAYDAHTDYELRQGLNGAFGDGPLCINSMDIAVTGDLTVGRTLAIPDVHSLTVTDGNLTVTGQDTFLFCHGVIDLGGGTLTLTDGAVLLGEVVNCGGIVIEDQAMMVAQDSLEVLSGSAEVTLSGGGHLISICPTTLDSVPVQISDNSVFRALGDLAVNNSGVEIGDYGNLLSNNVNVSFGNTVLTISERGYFSASANDAGFTCILWSVQNRGWIELGIPVRFGSFGTGSSSNSGTIQIGSDLTVAGALNNKGTILALNGAEIITQGTFIGNEPVARDQWANRPW